MDRMQRNSLSKEETDSIYLATTDVVEILNKIKNDEENSEDIEISLKELKRQATLEKILTLEEDFDIFESEPTEESVEGYIKFLKDNDDEMPENFYVSRSMKRRKEYD